jgi:hypothetical protein
MAATSIRQLYSRSVWLSDGTDSLWNFAFTGGYLDKLHVRAKMTNPETGAAELVPINYATDFVGPFQLLVVPNIPAGYEFTIYRDTPKDLPIVNFQDGGRISEVSLDTNAKQAVFIASETIDSVLDELYGVTLIDNEFGYKSMRHEPYTGASVVSLIDNGRSHYKTDATAVSVPDTLKVEFLSTIINDSVTNMNVSFPDGGAILQGSADVSLYTNWVLSPYSLLSITKVSAGRWFISGKATPV